MTQRINRGMPTLFGGPVDQVVRQIPIQFKTLNSDGRIGVEVHSLYSTAETGENGSAAAIIRYLPGSSASSHVHSGYELIYILDGDLETEDGIFPKDSLLVLRPGSVHTPRSPNGCLALVVWEKPVVTEGFQGRGPGTENSR